MFSCYVYSGISVFPRVKTSVFVVDFSSFLDVSLDSCLLVLWANICCFCGSVLLKCSVCVSFVFVFACWGVSTKGRFEYIFSLSVLGIFVFAVCLFETIIFIAVSGRHRHLFWGAGGQSICRQLVLAGSSRKNQVQEKQEET